jgi:ATP phosphoribosyltransferase regulatory subunit
LRNQGFSVARDIIERDQAASLDYAKRMHYRYLLVLEASQEELTLIRTADGESSCVTQDAIESGQFKI